MTSYQRAIKEWPEDERPRERLIKLGAEALSEAQLLAIVLSTGDASSGQSALDLAMLWYAHLMVCVRSMREHR